ncbi:hypothetical protein GCM10011396_37990 [Undibacterium terreum]|uniref:RHS repeat-associated core domain-containing protein n=1 Tax=Undibacterium terreum TaxID=1224302 RepID=A0A916UTH4_9BURK|nr:hypothetical protein GCM10011396_37990 [Undibacterium terreum]
MLTVSLAISNGPNFPAPGIIGMVATASDSDGTVTSVAFYNGATLLYTATSAPYTYTWSNPTIGTYSITAVATDSKGRSATSTALATNVVYPSGSGVNFISVAPTTTGQAIPGGTTLSAGITYTLKALTNDSINLVKLIEAGNAISSMPYSVSYLGENPVNTTRSGTLSAPLAIGVHQLHLQVETVEGYINDSATFTITVTRINAPPSITLQAPANGSILNLPANISLSATASDTDGTVSKVDYYNGSTLLSTVSTAPYSYNWNAPVGSYSITAVATDNDGGTTTSTAATGRVNAPPTVSVSVPGSATSAAGATLTATASDSDGSIQHVDFYSNGNLLGTASGSAGQYSFQWSNPPSGNFTITAKAYDNDNGVATSSGAAISIGGSAGNTGNVSLSATPTNIRVSPGATANITFNGSSTDDVQVQKLELFKDTGSGYGTTAMSTATGSAATLTFNYVFPAPAGTYRFKLRSTDNANNVTESTPVIVNVTDSSLLGTINGVRSNATGTPELYGWVCQDGNSQGLVYSVYRDAPSALGGTLLTSGIANVASEIDNAAIQSQCHTPGAGHHFVVDLSSYTSTYAGKSIYVEAQGATSGTVVLPCADNNCTMPGSLRIALTTPADGDHYVAPATVFARALISNGSGPYDEVAFNINGEWIAAQADTAINTYFASKADLPSSGTPYIVYAKVRKGNSTIYSVQNQIYVDPSTGVTLAVTSPTAATIVALSSPVALSANVSLQMGASAVTATVKFYANGQLVATSTNSSNWSAQWTPKQSGAVDITARAFDGSGKLLAQSLPVRIAVSASSGPAVPADATPVPVDVFVPHLGNDDAGTLGGELTVGSDGAASYSIPIVVPPGTANMAPNLSLNYSSSGTNGLLGLGWSVGGLSSIHRCGQTIAQDGTNNRISFDKTDRLCLDGKRLVLANLAMSDDNYWASNAEYRTEIESFSRITTQMNSSGQRMFKVETKDGRIMSFGGVNGTIDSSYVQAIIPQTPINSGVGVPQPQAKSGAQSWALSTIKDRIGNFITITYDQDGTTGEHKPRVIRYGANGLAPHAAVQFSYETRPDAWTRYIDETRNDLRSRITHIKTYVGGDLSGDVSTGTIVRDHTLSYEQSPTSGRSMLNSVQVCARKDGEVGTTTDCMPATTFAWGKPDPSKTPGFESKGLWANGPNLKTSYTTDGLTYTSYHPDYFAFSDFENNGYTDILEKRVMGLGSPIVEANGLAVGTMQTQYRYFHNTGSGFAQYTYKLDTNEPFIVLDTGDFNGDGVLDLLVTTNGTASGYAKICVSPLAAPGALGAPGSVITFTCGPANQAVGANSPKALPYVVDVRGDGRSAHYSTNNSGIVTVCIQGSCQQDPSPPDGLTIVSPDDGSDSYSQNQYTRLNQIVDFSGIGKPYDVRWTRLKYSAYVQDGVESIYLPHFDNLQPAVVINNFNPPGSPFGLGKMASYTYQPYQAPTPAVQHQEFMPYLFDRDTDMGGISTDFNGSGYNSIAFGFLELNWDQTHTYYSYNRSELTLCLSTGRALDCGIRQKYSGAQYLSVRAVNNFIGDGQATILVDELSYVPGKKPAPSGNLRMCRVTGDDTTNGSGVNDSNMVCDPWGGFTIPTSDSPSRLDKIFFLDLMGTGRTQIVQYHAADGTWEVFAPIDLAVTGQALDRIYQVTNGIGAGGTVEYVDAIPSGVVTQPGNTSWNYPQHASARSGKIARSLSLTNGVSYGSPITRKTTYRYEDPATDVAGRGSLGFAKVIATDELSQISTATTYSQTWPFTGMALVTTVSSGSNVTLSVSKNTPQAASITQTNGQVTYFPYIASNETKRYDLNSSYMGTTTTNNTYGDGWGNLTSQVVALDNNTYTSTESSVFRNDSANWIIGKPTSTTIKKTDQNSATVSRTSTKDYDAAGLILYETVGPTSGLSTQQLTTTYSRAGNNFGLVNKTTQTWLNANVTPTHASATNQTRTVNETIYDSNGRYPSTVKNALGHVETHAYDPATGARLSLTGPNQLTTTWAANGFGRVLKESRADGNETRQYQKKCDDSCPDGAVVANITENFHVSVPGSTGDRISVPQITYHDNAGRVIRSLSMGFDGTTIMQDQYYDSRGRLTLTMRPHYLDDSIYLDRYQEYDDLNRVTTLATLDELGAAVYTKTTYQGLDVITTNAKNQSRTEHHYLTGKVASVLDAKGGTTSFNYEAFGNLAQTTDPEGNVIKIQYDDMGHKTDLIDPNLGKIHYDVDALGRTWSQTSPNQKLLGKSTTMDFDDLDRMTARYEMDLESHWVYDARSDGTGNGKGIGQLAEAYTITGVKKDYQRLHNYDSLGRNNQIAQVLTDGTYTSTQVYDSWNRLLTQQYQRNSDAVKAFDYRYNGMGYQFQVLRGNRVLSETRVQDAENRIRGKQLDNGLYQASQFNNNTGRLETAQLTNTANAVHLLESYAYDSLGSVTHRTQYWDGVGFDEVFSYDDLNRISTSDVATEHQIYTYTPSGNLLTKSNVGGNATYQYPNPNSNPGINATTPHGVSSISGIGNFNYDLNGNLLTGAGRTITWTSFDMPSSIKKGSITDSFVYGPEHQRIRQCKSANGACTSLDNTIIYAGAQEVEYKNGQATVKTYWPNGLGVEIDKPFQSTELNWTHADRLGSPVAITDSNGNVKEKLAYDTWGKRRNFDASVTNGTVTPDSLDGQTDNKGFTGHEMLDDLDLVHMNGRVYDPLIAKFLSADPFIQDPTNGQNYNRYSYVLNNPTNFTDPTGFRADCAGSGTGLTSSGCGDWQTTYVAPKDNGSSRENAEPRAATNQTSISSSNTSRATGKDNPPNGQAGTIHDTQDSTIDHDGIPTTVRRTYWSAAPVTPHRYGTPAEIMAQWFSFNPVEQIALGYGASSRTAFWLGFGATMIGNPKKIIAEGIEKLAQKETKYLYRGVHAKHPALAAAKEGNVVPGKIDGVVTSAAHNEGGHSAESALTSWTREPSIAEFHADKAGIGGVILRVPEGAPSAGASWSWQISEDIWGESEVLMKGIRAGVEVLKR